MTFAQKTFAQKDVCPEGHLPRKHLPRRHLPRRKSAQKDICPERHLPRKTFAHKDSCPEDEYFLKHGCAARTPMLQALFIFWANVQLVTARDELSAISDINVNNANEGKCHFAFLWLKCTKLYADSCPILRTSCCRIRRTIFIPIVQGSSRGVVDG
jgi:hypothetical protein